ncbi:MAG: hypothetical protein ACO1SV_05665 [Fimbriimonas sp.]
MTASQTLRPNQYADTMRRSYTTLMHVAQVLGGTETEMNLHLYRHSVAETVASLTVRLALVDDKIAGGECEAFAALVDEDGQHGGGLEAMLHAVVKESQDLRPLPPILKACTDYDREHGTRLTGSAINALESLGLSLLASDREITADEIQLLQETIGAWRESGIALVRN